MKMPEIGNRRSEVGREGPAKPDSKVGNVPRLVGGLTSAWLEKTVQLNWQGIILT